MIEDVKEEQIWSILKLVDWSTNYLAQRGFDEARLNTELILCHVLGLRRIDLYLKYDMILSSQELSTFKSLFKRRLTHEPVQYILGYTELMDIRFEVTRDVLIPRPETEILIEGVITHCKLANPPVEKIFEIGTGSGCIAVSLTKHLPNLFITTIDKSFEALEVAKRNAVASNVKERINFINLDFLQNDLNSFSDNYDIIVSNPPYISKEEIDSLQPEVRLYEPQSAYTDFGDGLAFYKAISHHGNKMLHNDGWIFVEVGYNQNENVREIFKRDGYRNIEIIKDYDGNVRVVKAQKG